jgi:DNA invertase Pin-like site-specific DNA recombinase
MRAGLEIVQDYCDLAVSGRREGRPQLNSLMVAARNHEIDCVLVWKFDRFARSTRHLLTALEEFNHLGVRFISVQDQVDTDSPMGRAMFTIIGAMAELESSLISERVTAGMKAAEARGKHLGRPPTPQQIVIEIEALATSTDLSIRQIQSKITGRASRGIVGEITKRARSIQSSAL